MFDEQLAGVIKAKIRDRDKVLPDFYKLQTSEKKKIQEEILADHQKVLLQESQSSEEEKEDWRQLRFLIEAQSKRITDQDKIVYEKFTKPIVPKQTVFKNTVMAFLVGGLICTIGQILMNWTISMGLSLKEAGAITSGTLVFAGALLTGLGIYDEIGRFAGAGSIVPITGFANSIVSSALEFKREGYVYGVGAHLFTIAGPVLAYGTLVSFLVGVIYFLAR